MSYKKSDPVYHTGTWTDCREQVIDRQGGMCADCMRQFELGYIRKPHRIYMVHHIIPVKERPDLAYDLDNLIGLCFACHEQRHPERRQRKQDEERKPTGMRVVKV